ncbi:MAG: hypothetical protein KJ048_00445 [Dehalococcoidia bacterium]|nr:hypothetical protein [Dehalococcoidia bacterium]
MSRQIGKIALLLVAASVGPLLAVHAALVYFGLAPGRGIHMELSEPGGLAYPVLAAFSLSTGAALLVGTWRVWRAWLANREILAQASLKRSDGEEYWRVALPEVIVFSTGVRRARIFVTTGAEDALSEDALAAAVLHERAHIERGDLVLRPVLGVVERALGWEPLIRSWIASAILRSECEADADAVRAGANRRALFDAIVAASSSSLGTASLGGAPVMPRLERLADPSVPLPSVPLAGPPVMFFWVLAPPIAAHAALWIGLFCIGHV